MSPVAVFTTDDSFEISPGKASRLPFPLKSFGFEFRWIDLALFPTGNATEKFAGEIVFKIPDSARICAQPIVEAGRSLGGLTFGALIEYRSWFQFIVLLYVLSFWIIAFQIHRAGENLGLELLGALVYAASIRQFVFGQENNTEMFLVDALCLIPYLILLAEKFCRGEEELNGQSKRKISAKLAIIRKSTEQVRRQSIRR